MSASAYGNWITTVNEHVVRAVTTRLNYLHKGKKDGDRALLGEKMYGFAYVEALCKKLEHYEKNRKTYPTFASFYPKLVEAFKELSEMDLGSDFYLIPFNGTINAVSANRHDVILVVPTNERDKTAQKNIHDYVITIKERFYKNNQLITDTEALSRDLSEYAVVMYGTTEGNLLLAKYMKEMPVHIQKNKILADKAYDGENLRFITAWPNPQNTKRGILIYTAQRSEDIPGINSLFHGPTDFVIARELKILHAGDYIKNNTIWNFK
jgi:DNA-dependent RNA polymerase auxiliary subunit epsilon